MEPIKIKPLDVGLNKTTVFFCGGGTLGPVTPLLALAEAWAKKDSSVKLVFVGTPDGPEKELVEKFGFTFTFLPKAKLPRYFSLEWFYFPGVFVAALFKSWKILSSVDGEKRLIVSAGGYTAVPMILVGWLLGVRSWIHQQDVRPLLSNKITASFASLITVTWEKSLKDFSVTKTKLVGNPIRSSFLSANRDEAVEHFSLNKNKLTVLVIGGGTGSLWINEAMAEIGGELVKEANVIHITGKNKMAEKLKNFGADYHSFELLTVETSQAFAAADLIICRAGMGTITELAALHKPAIVIPLPDSPQEDNAAELEKNEAAIIVKQKDVDAAQLLFIIRFLLADESRRCMLGETIRYVFKTDVADEMVEMGQGILVEGN